LILGHCGNTLAAFAASRAAGADGVELDVRRAGDGTLAVHHDPTIDGIGRIADLTRAELSEVVPTLAAALRDNAGVIVNVELKNLPVDPDYDPTEELAGLTRAVIADADAASRVIVSSFSLATLDAMRALEPAIPTAFLTLPRWDQARAVTAAADHGHNALHPHVKSVDAALVARVHRAGMTIHPWAVDDAATAVEVGDLGVDALITDAPALVVPALRRT
jgi:glycerophosphoryl diester phosphodiesterase